MWPRSIRKSDYGSFNLRWSLLLKATATGKVGSRPQLQGWSPWQLGDRWRSSGMNERILRQSMSWSFVYRCTRTHWLSHWLFLNPLWLTFDLLCEDVSKHFHRPQQRSHDSSGCFLLFHLSRRSEIIKNNNPRSCFSRRESDFLFHFYIRKKWIFLSSISLKTGTFTATHVGD